MWDVEAWQRLGGPLLGATEAQGLVFLPAGSKLAITNVDGSITLWNTATLERLGEFCAPPARSHLNQVTSLAFSPDGSALAASGTFSFNHPPPREGQEQHDLVGHDHAGASRYPLAGYWLEVVALAFGKDGESLVSDSIDRLIVMWHLPTRQRLEVAAPPAGWEPWIRLLPCRHKRGWHDNRNCRRQGCALGWSRRSVVGTCLPNRYSKPGPGRGVASLHGAQPYAVTCPKLQDDDLPPARPLLGRRLYLAPCLHSRLLRSRFGPESRDGPPVRDGSQGPLVNDPGALADRDRAAFADDRPECLVTDTIFPCGRANTRFLPTLTLTSGHCSLGLSGRLTTAA